MKYLVAHSFTVKVILLGISLMYLENLSITISNTSFPAFNSGKAMIKSIETVARGSSNAEMGFNSL